MLLAVIVPYALRHGTLANCRFARDRFQVLVNDVPEIRAARQTTVGADKQGPTRPVPRIEVEAVDIRMQAFSPTAPAQIAGPVVGGHQDTDCQPINTIVGSTGETAMQLL